MSFKVEKGDFVSETGNWNVADSYSKTKIMKPIENCEVYEDIAIYGFDSFFEELISFEIDTDELRVKGLNRLINELIKLSKNCLFAMKKAGTQQELLNHLTNLLKIRDKAYPMCYKVTTNEAAGLRQVKIVEPAFTKVLEAVSAIKSLINEPLNKNNLIFTDREEFDAKAFKQRIKERMIEKG